MKIKITLAIITICSIWYYLGNTIGYNNGLSKGYGAALDTVRIICDKQFKSDTSVTKLIIINPDTTIIYLSRRTPLSN